MMISALVVSTGPALPSFLVQDLESVGIQVLGCLGDPGKLVQEVHRQSPDVLVCDAPHSLDELFKALQVISDTAPCPVMVFSGNSDAEKIVRATELGVHAYVVNGYGKPRLRPLIHLAQARFRREHKLRAELQDITSRFEERKMVDRAKGILMRARQVSDDDAFQMLRTASMHTNRRLGLVSEHIIASAHFAEAVNRAGQLRMLSQRLVKLYLLQLAGMLPATASHQLGESVLRVDSNLALLGKSLSKATYGDLLGQLQRTWSRLKPALQHPGPSGQMHGQEQVDELAEQLLQEAESLTASLEDAGAAPPLHVLNVSGRQRMLSQRMAKYVLLEVLGHSSPDLTASRQAAFSEASAAFEAALRDLKELPLTSPSIRDGLNEATKLWELMRASAEQAQRFAGRRGQGARGAVDGLAVASEGLLEAFEKLTGQYESSMQMLLGA